MFICKCWRYSWCILHIHTVLLPYRSIPSMSSTFSLSIYKAKTLWSTPSSILDWTCSPVGCDSSVNRWEEMRAVMFFSEIWKKLLTGFKLQSVFPPPICPTCFARARLSAIIAFWIPQQRWSTSSTVMWSPRIVMSLSQQSRARGWKPGRGQSGNRSWGLTQGGSTNSHMLWLSPWPVWQQTAVL